MNRCFLLIIFLHFIVLTCAAQSLKLVKQRITLRNEISFQLSVPESYRIAAVAEGLKRPRFFAKSPDNRLFVTDMYDRSDNNRGKILILEQWSEKEKRFLKVTTYLDGLRNPNSIAFYSSGNRYYLYVAETDSLRYFVYHPGDAKPHDAGTLIATFPDYGLNYKYGGWHLTRSLAIHNHKLYVSVGSSCNACIETETVRAALLQMDMDGRNAIVYARGLRNSVGIKWVNGELWATGMGRDLAGPDRPEDLFHRVHKNGYYGWPFYYQYKKKIFPDTLFRDSVRAAFVKPPPVAEWGFRAHSAPLGFEYISGFRDTLLNNSFLVALHGSTSVWRQRGNSVVQLRADGTYREIVTGFLQGKTERLRYGRPCDVIQWDDHSFFISDDKNGVIYFVWKQ